MEKFSPAVSVIIPMFNAEKYLPVCLESLLIQTLTDFEVIVVDDCSTDQSATIAESYLERFGGRLKIVTLPTNTGSGAVPRNVGLNFARGKYVYFMDADDLLVDNALETLYDFAENFQADVVCMEKFFTCGTEPLPTDFGVTLWNPDNIVDEPTYESDNLVERVENFLKLRFWWPPWTKFVRRDLLVDNDIKFPAMRISEDVIWTFELISLAKKFLHVSEPLYVYRDTAASMVRRARPLDNEIKFCLNPLINGVDFLHEFMNRLEFFNDKPTLRLQVLNFLVLHQCHHMWNIAQNLPTEEVYEIFLHEFKAAGSSQPALISYLLVMNNLYRNELLK